MAPSLGAGDRVRTCNRRITNPLLYQLSYTSASRSHPQRLWWLRRARDRRPALTPSHQHQPHSRRCAFSSQSGASTRRVLGRRAPGRRRTYLQPERSLTEESQTRDAERPHENDQNHVNPFCASRRPVTPRFGPAGRLRRPHGPAWPPCRSGRWGRAGPRAGDRCCRCGGRS